MTYKWMKDRQEIPDAKNIDKLTITSFSSENQGNYTCNVVSGRQSVESESASLRLGMNLLTYIICIVLVMIIILLLCVYCPKHNVEVEYL